MAQTDRGRAARAAAEHHIVDPPGEYFLYDKYHPQLLGMILERATGMSVTEFTQTRLWDRLGMEFDGAWALDSEASGQVIYVSPARDGIIVRNGLEYGIPLEDWIDTFYRLAPEL